MRRADVPVHPGCGGVKVGLLLKKFAFIIFLFFASQSDAQPQATLKPHEQTAPLNRELRVTLELVWKGEADLYDVPQPDLSELEGLEVVARNLSAERSGNENRLRYEFMLKPLREGELDLGQMRANYYEKGEDAPVLISLPRTPVIITGPELLGRTAKAAIGLGLAMITAGVVGIRIFRSRKASIAKKRQDSDAAEATRSNLLARVERARSLLIEGNPAAYFETLCEIASSEPLRASSQKLDELLDLTETVKFGSHTPSPDEIRWAEKQVRAAILKAFPTVEGLEKD
jgi:hypothetical protein